ncbi:MAG: hypothetical protein ATN36_08040 [Epulopiscium sp. Nele67-Bin005]|nr:MAG: hypothetical protein ATN36_08040 [Epulopiscium sp. Nele67-Bin005]
MKISEHIYINKRIRWKSKLKLDITTGNYPPKLYFLCTSPYHDKNFEIIQGKYMHEHYKSVYLVGIAKDKETLINNLVELIDLLYNKKTITYEMLQNEQRGEK